ncbi:proteasome subunit alpha type [Gregarina niphandrodes]|uniref:Proteasome subunit alpha type n=1 Tax=Gregarina niphandrodes TaxID=110365 RepID=A0A023B6F8_GRENI|nr:proteasome subunit alpha type [Gregarina niphandrodes]EZG66412.1 proteasome subunit alpha type [Gregarina niphandrodes]|eukprot:XP_011134004.1 proteasome subunit alpha type [Gregarina niphandrodes]
MYASRNEYDRGVNTFSPEGRLFQVEYALGAVNLGATAIGIRTSEGVVLATEKRLGSKLIEETEDLKKVVEIDKHIACASAGIIADSRTLIDRGRSDAANYWFVYGQPVPVESCVNSIAAFMLDFSGVNTNRKKVVSRPFGVSLLVGGVDKQAGPSLWCCDPSGSTVQYQAVAIGSGHEGADSKLQENYKPDMTLDQAVSLALLVLRQVMEDRMTAKNVEVSLVPADKAKVHAMTELEIENAMAGLPAAQDWERMRGV